LKALHIARFDGIWRVHDLVRLARKLDAPDNIVESCALVNPAYTASRYPDVSDEYGEDEASEAIAAAEEVIEWAEKTLGS